MVADLERLIAELRSKCPAIEKSPWLETAVRAVPRHLFIERYAASFATNDPWGPAEWVTVDRLNPSPEALEADLLGPGTHDEAAAGAQRRRAAGPGADDAPRAGAGAGHEGPGDRHGIGLERRPDRARRRPRRPGPFRRHPARPGRAGARASDGGRASRRAAQCRRRRCGMAGSCSLRSHRRHGRMPGPPAGVAGPAHGRRSPPGSAPSARLRCAAAASSEGRSGLHRRVPRAVVLHDSPRGAHHTDTHDQIIIDDIPQGLPVTSASLPEFDQRRLPVVPVRDE